jgi:hypothetical protein
MKEYDYEIDDSHLIATNLSGDVSGKKKRAMAIIQSVRSIKEEYDAARRVREDTWLESWAAYLGTPQSNRWVRQRISQVVGNVQADWRHQLTTSKAFEIVETVNSWLQGAFFPNHNWFDLLPKSYVGDPEWKKYLRMMKKYTHKKLTDAMFVDHWDANVRQAIITGTSCIALPWRYETKHSFRNVLIRDPHEGDLVTAQPTERVVKNAPELEVLDMFDVWLDPGARNPNDSNFIRRIIKTKGEVIRLVEEGVYDLTTVKKIQEMKPKDTLPNTKRHELNDFLGISNSVGYWSPTDTIEIIEFWGDLRLKDIEYSDVVVAIAGDCLLAFETNPFWEGKPFIFTTYIPVLNSPYGLSALDPVLGNIHELNIIMNQRLDGGELATNPMWEVLNDGTVDLDQIYTEPGRTIPVAQMGALKPIPRDTDFQYSITEEQLLSSKIEKATGTTPFIAAGVGRSGERVTAQEINAQREAGGNRLNGIHRHIEYNALMPLLKRTYAYMQQFVTVPEVVRIRGEQPGSWEYLEVGPGQLSIDMDVIPLGADHIANREFELKNRLDFLQAVSSVPQMAEQLNWTEVLIDLASRFLEEDYERFINAEAPQAYGAALPDQTAALQGAAPEAQPEESLGGSIPVGLGGGGVAPISSQDLSAIEEAAQFSGGQPAVGALKASMMAQPVGDILEQLRSGLGI